MSKASRTAMRRFINRLNRLQTQNLRSGGVNVGFSRRSASFINVYRSFGIRPERMLVRELRLAAAAERMLARSRLLATPVIAGANLVAVFDEIVGMAGGKGVHK